MGFIRFTGNSVAVGAIAPATGPLYDALAGLAQGLAITAAMRADGLSTLTGGAVRGIVSAGTGAAIAEQKFDLVWSDAGAGSYRLAFYQHDGTTQQAATSDSAPLAAFGGAGSTVHVCVSHDASRTTDRVRFDVFTSSGGAILGSGTGGAARQPLRTTGTDVGRLRVARTAVTPGNFAAYPSPIDWLAIWSTPPAGDARWQKPAPGAPGLLSLFDFTEQSGNATTGSDGTVLTLSGHTWAGATLDPALGLTLDAASGTVARPGVQPVTVTVARGTPAYAGELRVTLDTPPTGISGTLLLPAGATSGVLTIAVAAGAPTGNHPLTLRVAPADGVGATAATAAFTLQVDAGAPVGVAVVGGPVVLEETGQVARLLLVTRPPGYTGTVALAASGLPSGVTALFRPATLEAGVTRALVHLRAADGAAVGQTTPLVQATALGVGSGTAALPLEVRAATIGVGAWQLDVEALAEQLLGWTPVAASLGVATSDPAVATISASGRVVRLSNAPVDVVLTIVERDGDQRVVHVPIPTA